MQMAFTEQLRRALEKPYGKRKRRRLEVAADKLALAACKGEPWAIAQIANRLDGLPAQAIESTMTFGPSDAMIEFLRAVGRGEYVGKEATIINSVPLLAEGAKEPAE
jgi:hypothetical protein